MAFQAKGGDVVWLQATHSSYKIGEKKEIAWTPWRECNVRIAVNFSKDVIVIYTRKTQVFKILREVEETYDDKSVLVTFLSLDSNRKRAYVRIRDMNDGRVQIYVEYLDMSLVFHCLRLNDYG